MIHKVRFTRNTTEMIFDLDSTHSDKYRKQEKTDYNAHYQTNGYHPLFAFDGLTETVFRTYRKQGTIENFIKEAKNGFYFDKTDSPFSLENHTYVMVTCIPETPNYDLTKTS